MLLFYQHRDTLSLTLINAGLFAQPPDHGHTDVVNIDPAKWIAHGPFSAAPA